jgi:16S rRNA (cytosine967-C5)-methyltransferase
LTPGARLLAVVEIINDIFLQPIDDNFSSDKIIKNWIRNSRYAGSKDRKEIINNVFGIIKRYFSLDYIQKNNVTLEEHSLELTIIYFIFYGGGKTSLTSRFNDGPYAIKMTESINGYIEKISAYNFDEIEFVKCALPDWLYAEFYESFKNDTLKVCESFFKESNFDIRVKKDLSRDEIIQKLNNYNISSEKTPFSPIGIRINKRIPINNLIEFKKGLIEIQDEGSQLVSLLCGAKENETIIDLCAGAGGKSLLLADLLNNIKIIATDINLIRLDKIKDRAKRNKVEDKINIELNYHNLNILADRVICDVPCSGSGAWRRRPEEKISLTNNKFKELLKTQRDILDYGSSLTKIGGELVYITCSILNKENKSQINAFLQDNPNFEIVDLKYSWDSITNSKQWFGNEKYCQLLPNIHECDGFFIARLIKTN